VQGLSGVTLEGVGVVKGAGDLRSDPRDEIDGQSCAVFRSADEDFVERLTVEVLHGHVQAFALLTQREGTDDVGVLEKNGDPRFIEEHLHEFAFEREVLVDDLEGDDVLRRRVFLRAGLDIEAQIHRSSAADAQASADEVRAELGALDPYLSLRVLWFA
jgi:hypothetical protein